MTTTNKTKNPTNLLKIVNDTNLGYNVNREEGKIQYRRNLIILSNEAIKIRLNLIA